MVIECFGILVQWAVMDVPLSNIIAEIIINSISMNF